MAAEVLARPLALTRMQRPRPVPPTAGVAAALLAVCGVRTGSVVLDLTPAARMVRPAAAAAGRTGLVFAASASAMADGVHGALRGGIVTHAFAALPGSRLLTAMRPVLRAGARVAVTAVDEDAIREAAVVAAYEILHVEHDVDGLVIAGLRPRTAC